MKKFIILVAFLKCVNSSAQGLPMPTNQKNMLYFWYDKNGNRIKRHISILDCQAMEIPPNEDLLPHGKRGNDTIVTKIDPERLGLKLFPNPTTNYVNISINSNFTLEGSSILVYDVSGKLVFEKQQVQNKTIEFFSVEFFPTGTYFVKLKLSSNKIIVWTIEKK